MGSVFWQGCAASAHKLTFANRAPSRHDSASLVSMAASDQLWWVPQYVRFSPRLALSFLPSYMVSVSFVLS